MGIRRLVLLLHAHLPECRQPDNGTSLEETWYFEALAESYLPVLAALDRLAADAIPCALTLSVSPTLIGMLGDRALGARFLERMESTHRLAMEDAGAAPPGPLRNAALWHAAFFLEAARSFRACGQAGVLGALRARADAGLLELGTTAATHGFLPAHQGNPAVVRAQIGVGADTFEDAFGRRAAFFWLPECAYFPGVERELAAAGVRVTALETHGVLQARPPPPNGVRAPVRCPGGVMALGRDAALSRRVWSAADGYPGHPDYREFHRDRVHGLSEESLRRWLGRSDRRLPSGLKYWRVTGPGEEKAWYDPEAAARRTGEHARDFVRRVVEAPGTGGLWFVPFDAELFGHWWFEGPLWLEAVYREAARRGIAVATATAAASAPDPDFPVHEARPAPSSWGESGDYSYWINHDNAWIYPRLDAAARRLAGLLQAGGGPPAQTPSDPDRLRERLLGQAARTLLLAQASDWPFLMRAGTAREAACAGVEALLGRFNGLCDALDPGASRQAAEARLCACERLDAAFPRINLAHLRAS